MSTGQMSFLNKIGSYFSLIKFSHTIFAMPFAFIGFVLGILDAHTGRNLFSASNGLLALKMVLCMIFARSAAMSFNRYLDRKYDALNPRTARREIPAGVITPGNALAFTILSSAAFVITTYFINLLCCYLSFVALAVILFYSYTKRFTALCHLVLGLGLSLAPIGAYLTVTGAFALTPVLFSLSVVTWVSGFDIIYALQDEGFDRENKLFSIPAMLGAARALRVSELLHFCSVVFIVLAGVSAGFGWIYWAGVAIYASMIVYQHLLVKPGDLAKVNVAFANTNGLASVVFSIFTIIAILLKF